MSPTSAILLMHGAFVQKNAYPLPTWGEFHDVFESLGIFEVPS